MTNSQHIFDFVGCDLSLPRDRNDYSSQFLTAKWHDGDLPDLRERRFVGLVHTHRLPSIIEQSVKGGVEGDGEIKGFHELNVRLEILR